MSTRWKGFFYGFNFAQRHLCSLNTLSEENHLKALFILSKRQADTRITTNTLAHYLENRAASITDMMKRLSERALVDYKPYKGAALTPEGRLVAARIIRKHRLWETFLVEKLGFGWEEVHEVAEQLEHIDSPRLIDRIDALLGYPECDPHGDPIPRADGSMPQQALRPLNDVAPGTRVHISRVIDDSAAFLDYLRQMGLSRGQVVVVKKRLDFDGSCVLQLEQGHEVTISARAGSMIWIESPAQND